MQNTHKISKRVFEVLRSFEGDAELIMREGDFGLTYDAPDGIGCMAFHKALQPFADELQSDTVGGECYVYGLIDAGNPVCKKRIEKIVNQFVAEYELNVTEPLWFASDTTAAKRYLDKLAAYR